MLCSVILEQRCPNGHTIRRQCHEGLPSTFCSKCDKEKQEVAKQARKDLDEQLRRDEMIQKHQKELEKIQKDIEKAQQGIQDARLISEQQAVLAQKRKDLIVVEDRLKQMKSTPPQYRSNKPSPPPHTTSSVVGNTSPQSIIISTQTARSDVSQLKLPGMEENPHKNLHLCLDHNSSTSKTEWQRQKDQENAKNPAIDQIMDMIGLEDVKSQVLRIKSKVDTSKRQGTDLKKERLGLVLLGNPGTGSSSISNYVMCSDF